MGDIVPNQLFIAGYSRSKISDDRGIKDIFKKYGTVKEVAYKGSYSFVTFSSESEAQDALKALNGQTINGQKLKVDMVDNRKGRRNGPQENDECFKCGKGGHWQEVQHLAQGQGLSKSLISEKEEIFRFTIQTPSLQKIKLSLSFLFIVLFLQVKETKTLEEEKQQIQQKPKEIGLEEKKYQSQKIANKLKVQIISQQQIASVTQVIFIEMRKDQIRKRNQKLKKNKPLPSIFYFLSFSGLQNSCVYQRFKQTISILSLNFGQLDYLNQQRPYLMTNCPQLLQFFYCSNQYKIICNQMKLRYILTDYQSPNLSPLYVYIKITNMGCAAQKMIINKMTFDEQIENIKGNEDLTFNQGMVAFKSLQYEHMVQNLESLQITCSPEHPRKQTPNIRFIEQI